MEVRGTAQVVVLGGDPLGRGRRTLDEVAPVGQDVAHMAVLPGAEIERQRQRTGSFDALRAIALGQAEQPQAASVAMLGMAEALQQLGDEAQVFTPMSPPSGSAAGTNASVMRASSFNPTNECDTR